MKTPLVERERQREIQREREREREMERSRPNIIFLWTDAGYISLVLLSSAGGPHMLSSVIFFMCGCLTMCGCCCFWCCQKCRSRHHMWSQINSNNIIATCTLMSDKEVQMPSLQTKRPQPSPPPPIYEYIPSARPSANISESIVHYQWQDNPKNWLSFCIYKLHA